LLVHAVSEIREGGREGGRDGLVEGREGEREGCAYLLFLPFALLSPVFSFLGQPLW